MTIGVPIVTCLLRVRRIHKAETLQTPSCGDATRGCSPVPPPVSCSLRLRHPLRRRDLPQPMHRARALHYIYAALFQCCPGCTHVLSSRLPWRPGPGHCSARLAAGPPAPFQTCVNFAFTACRLADFAPCITIRCKFCRRSALMCGR